MAAARGPYCTGAFTPSGACGLPSPSDEGGREEFFKFCPTRASSATCSRSPPPAPRPALPAPATPRSRHPARPAASAAARCFAQPGNITRRARRIEHMCSSPQSALSDQRDTPSWLTRTPRAHPDARPIQLPGSRGALGGDRLRLDVRLPGRGCLLPTYSGRDARRYAPRLQIPPGWSVAAMIWDCGCHGL